MTVERIEAFWENATADDVAGIVKTGKPIPARFRDDEHSGYTEGFLAGWTEGEPCWYCEQGGARSYFETCQVYREPSWFASKPDPGPGYRLLGKFPDEPKLATDEALQYDGTTWNRVRTDSGVQDLGVWYRRRIEPVEPEPRPILTDWQCREGDTYRHPNGLRLAITEKGFEVTQ